MSRDEVHGLEHLHARRGAMTEVFRRFSASWGGTFRANRVAELLDTWMDSCVGIDTDLLEIAARKFLVDAPPTYPPKAWEFAKFARGLQRQRRGDAEPMAEVGSTVERVWQWVDPASGRLQRVEQRSEGWVFSAQVDWRGMDDRELVGMLNRLAFEHEPAWMQRERGVSA